MTRPTDAAVALVTSALMHDGVYDLLEGWVNGECVTRADIASALLAHPTLARVIAIGQAWLAAEGALPEDAEAGGPEIYHHPDSDGPLWQATGWAPGPVTAEGPTPEAALLALAAALADQERGS